ncbi:MAG: alpha/beta hydrolase family esterase [Chloroflexota bacterium]
MKRHKFLWYVGLLFACMLVSVDHTQASTVDRVDGVLSYDGIDRFYHLVLPENHTPDNPASLIIALHPFTSSAKAMAGMTGLDDAAEAGYIVAYPQSVGFYWDDGRTAAGIPPVHEAIDDVGFLLALRETLANAYPVDLARVYLADFDNGGLMALRTVCEAPELFAGVTVVGAQMWDYHFADCPRDEAAPLDILIFTGDLDQIYNADGRVVILADGTRRVVEPLSETIDYWADRLDCQLDDTVTEPHLAAFRCDRSMLTVYTVQGGGHVWYQPGRRTQVIDVDVTDKMLAFFAGNASWRDAPGFIPDEGDGPPRSYRVYVPAAYDPLEAMLLIVALHGRDANGAWMALATEFNTYAEQEGFIVVYPDGNQLAWSYLGVRMPQFWDRRVDDTRFLPQLVAEMALDFNIDRSRVCLTGFSNGGFMTQRSACENNDIFAAFAAVGALMYPGMDRHCLGELPVPLLLMLGTEDRSTRWDGYYQGVGPGAVLISYPFIDTLRFCVGHNGCAGVPVSEELPGDQPDTRVIHSVFVDCDSAPPIEAYIIEGGGHNWPGVPGVISEDIAGRVNTEIHTSDVIWSFLSRFTLSAR